VGIIQSNSGDSLKLLIPSLYLNNKSGLNNFKESVTIQNQQETVRGNRGSKTARLSLPPRTGERNINVVKEQRVDGCRYFKFKYLRCSLMSDESRYIINNPSKQFNINNSKASFSTSIDKNNLSLTKLNPWFITGFSDAESSFTVTISPDIRSKLK